MSSKVYFTDFRCPVGTSMIEKVKRLCKKLEYMISISMENLPL